MLLARRSVKCYRTVIQPRQHTIYIPVQRRVGLVVRKGRDSTRRIIAYPRQRTDRRKFCRKNTTVLIHNHLCCLIHIPRTRVITQSLPIAQYLILRRTSQTSHIAKSLHKAQIIRQTLLHTSLLKDDFRHPYPIRIVRLTPWQFTTI